MMEAAAELAESKQLSVGEKLAAYYELTKPRIAFLLVLTSAASFYLGSNGGFDAVRFANAMISIALLAFGVSTLNQYLERHIDPLMERTAKRPLPTQRLAPIEALIFGILPALFIVILGPAAIQFGSRFGSN